MGNLFQELKRRKVFKVGTAYAVVAFVLAQVADLVLPTFDAPDWVLQSIIFVFVLGFPLAILLAWAYEVTPEGIKPDFAAQSAPSTASNTDRKLIYAILGLVLLVAGFQIVEQFNGNSESANPIAITDSQATAAASSSERVRRTIVPLGPMVPARSGDQTSLSLSPDGTRLAYASFSEGKTQLHLRELNQLQSRPLGPPFETRAANSAPVFSPDGEWLAFLDTSSLKRIALNGGRVQTIAEDVLDIGFDWTADDALLFSLSNFALVQIDASSGVVEELVAPTTAGDILGFPLSLGGSDVILYTEILGAFGSGEPSLSIQLFDKQTGESRPLIPNAANATYSATGHIVFGREDSLWAVPFDRENLQINGNEVEVIEGVAGSRQFLYTLSKNGDLLYLPGEGSDRQQPNSTLSWVDRRGAETPLELPPQFYAMPTLSPDGTQLALIVGAPEGGVDLWKYELTRRTWSKMTFSGFAQTPLWSPDGDRLVYDTPEGIRAINATGIGNPEVLLAVPNNFVVERRLAAFTPDGTGLIYFEQDANEGNIVPTSISQLSMAPEHTIQEVIAPEYLSGGGSISPDGRWLAYMTSETGQDEVYIRPWPDVDSNKWPISSGGGRDPQWAADTGELFYQNNTEDGIETWVVSVAAEGNFNSDIPELLFTSNHRNEAWSTYSVTADGQHFLMLKPGEDAVAVAVDTNLVLVENFAAELRRLAPASTQ